MSDKGFNRRALESLVKTGAFDQFGVNRRRLDINIDYLLNSINNEQKNKVSGQLDLFSVPEVVQDTKFTFKDDEHFPPAEDYSDTEKLNLEKQLAGIYLSGHPLERYAETAKKLRCDKLSEINSAVSDGDKSKYRDGRTVTLLGLVAEKK